MLKLIIEKKKKTRKKKPLMDLFLNYLAESNLKKKIQKYNKFQTKKKVKKKTQKKIIKRNI